MRTSQFHLVKGRGRVEELEKEQDRYKRYKRGRTEAHERDNRGTKDVQHGEHEMNNRGTTEVQQRPYTELKIHNTNF